ncbi:MAG: hypothetical protein RL571_1198 [Pseudomonadota bacterium]
MNAGASTCQRSFPSFNYPTSKQRRFFSAMRSSQLRASSSIGRDAVLFSATGVALTEVHPKKWDSCPYFWGVFISKYTAQCKLSVVQQYLTGEAGIKTIAKQHGITYLFNMYLRTALLCSSKVLENTELPSPFATKYKAVVGAGLSAALSAASPTIAIGVGGKPLRV